MTLGFRKDSGIWLRVICWMSLILNPIGIAIYSALWVNDILAPAVFVWYSINAICGMYIATLLLKGLKIGWWMLIVVSIVSASVTTLVNPSQWWVFLTTGIAIVLWWLTLRHKGYWNRMN